MITALLAPVASSLGIDLIWFGIVIALVLQTSFLTPPFGFALLYLRSVAPRKSYLDPSTQKMIAPVETKQIWKGSAYFVVLQLFVVALVVYYPSLAGGGLNKNTVLSEEEIMLHLNVDLNSLSTSNTWEEPLENPFNDNELNQ